MKFLRMLRNNEFPPIVLLSAADFISRIFIQIYVTILSREIELDTLALLLLAQGLISLPIQLSDGAINPEAIRRVTTGDSNKKLTILIQSKLIISFFLTIATAAYILIFDIALIPYFLIMLPTIIFQTLNLQFIQQAELKFSFISFTRLITGFTLMLVGLLLLQDSNDLPSYLFLLPYVVASFFSMAMSFSLLRLPILKNIFTAWKYSGILSILKSTLPIGFVFLFLQIFQFSTLILSSIAGSSDLFEQIGLNSRIWFLFAIPIGIFPAAYLSKILSKDLDMHKTMRKIFIYYSIILFLSFSLMPMLMNVLYGYKAMQYALGVSLYLLSIPFFAVSNIAILALISKNRGLEAVRALIFATVCNLVLQILFNKNFIGVALSWLIANLLLSLLVVFITRKRDKSKTLLISAAGFGNIGDDFILENELGMISEDIDVSILCGPARDRLQIRRLVQFLPIDGLFYRFRNLFYVIRSNRVKFVGGGLFAENNQFYYRPYARILLIVVFLNKRVEVQSVQVDYINSTFYRLVLRRCLERVKSSSVRDLISYNHLSSAARANFSIVDDLANLRKPLYMNLKPTELCINLRSFKDGSELSDDFFNEFAFFLNLNVQPTDKVVLLSMMENNFESDSKLLIKLKDKLFFDTEVIYPSSTLQAMEVIASSNRVIAMRLHCVVFAKLFERNVLAIPYAKKVSSFAQTHAITCAYFDALSQPLENWWNESE